MMVRGVRGATTVEANDRDQILQATRELLALLIRLNGIEPADVASAIFSATDDLSTEYPALAARQLGWFDVALMCTRELNITNGLPRCIRVLIHWNTAKPQSELHHVYLRQAKRLRPDKSDLPPIDQEALERWIDEQLAHFQSPRS